MTLNQIQQNLANVPEGTDCFPGDITILAANPRLATIFKHNNYGSASAWCAIGTCSCALHCSHSTIDPLKFQIRCRRSVGGQNCSPTGSSKPSNENSANRLTTTATALIDSSAYKALEKPTIHATKHRSYNKQVADRNSAIVTAPSPIANSATATQAACRSPIEHKPLSIKHKPSQQRHHKLAR